MDLEKEYHSRFDHRQRRHIENLAELTRIAHPGGPELLYHLPGLKAERVSSDSIDALKWSIIMLWLQGTECFIFGQFEPSILAIGAVMERVLKLEYLTANESLPSGTWTLGKCIHELSWSGTRITKDHLYHAKMILEPRNSRAHALLEHKDPQSSILGGNRGIDQISNSRYIIEPYRGEAVGIIKNTWFCLSDLYGHG